MPQRDISPRQRAWVVGCSVISAACTIVVGVLESNDVDERNEREKRSEYEQCLSEERERIAEEGSLLEPEDFCDIYGSP
ncbi:hypothetical protein DVA86_18555 [Streptomyces armeniacus]|uniref:Uncharacterized protein n=1 Tax=Streptomyces armeniacus TaxID=83291 RepID=A0A345XRT5_9ACTN|nr:hypothetical protein [Streptomyces armeniacus]AXK34351.1 hypothetical protein DVA86_18555 [Streptomyces armeniacus]